MPGNLCNVPPEMRRSVEGLETFIQDLRKTSGGLTNWSLDMLRNMQLGDDHMKALSDLGIPFGCPTDKKCPHSVGAMTRCCGQCTRNCDTRCVQDILTRIYMLVHPWRDVPEEQRPLQIKLIMLQLEDPRKTSYRALTQIANDLQSISHNPKLRAYKAQFKERGETIENPDHLDYAPAYIYYQDPKTHQEKIKCDPDTGVCGLRHWPESGLCPWCLPRKLVNARAQISAKKRAAKAKRDAERAERKRRRESGER